MTRQPVLIANQWRASAGLSDFQAENPNTKTALGECYPVSDWSDCLAALQAAASAAEQLRKTSPTVIATFLENYATAMESEKEALVAMAHAESGLPASPRLADVELPRTTMQLRQAAAATRDGSWSMPTLDVKNNIRSYLAPLGPVIVFGPNNFPFAFNSIAGGDFAAALAAGNPVIAKANTSHPGTTRLLANIAHKVALESQLPAGTIQLLYRTSHADGAKLVADARVGAIAYTGSRHAGLALKAAADAAGKPIYLELSSVNPVVFLPSALQERLEDCATQFVTSCLMGAGQFCTNPGLVLLLAGNTTEQFLAQVGEKFAAAPAGTLLSRGVRDSLQTGIATLQKAGAKVVAKSENVPAERYCCANTLLRASGSDFLRDPKQLQTEAFGNAALVVVAEHVDQLTACLQVLEGNLTGCIYSETQGKEESLYNQVAFHLRPKVGRLLNDKMPTGVAVSPAMNHGGPYPATGHPGFTAVGIPASLRRFGMLQCFDNIRDSRLPPILQNTNPNGCQRLIDGTWTTASV
jgi:2,5-dioxopentanoate dehydrogenase